MEIQFKVAGFILMFLAAVHVIFPKYFCWKTELATLSLVNRQMMVVHTFFIALTVFMMGWLCAFSTTDLLNTALGKTISLGFGIFWLVRLYFQFFVYSPQLWLGKKFETLVHIVFSGLWIYLSTLYFWNYFS